MAASCGRKASASPLKRRTGQYVREYERVCSQALLLDKIGNLMQVSSGVTTAASTRILSLWRVGSLAMY